MTPVDGRDPEVLAVLLELAAIELTPTAHTTFTRDDLVELAREISGPEVNLRDEDIDSVLRTINTLERLPGDLYSLR